MLDAQRGWTDRLFPLARLTCPTVQGKIVGDSWRESHVGSAGGRQLEGSTCNPGGLATVGNKHTRTEIIGCGKMKRSAIAEFVIQAVALGFGLLGVTWVCLGIYSPVIGIREADLFVMFFMTPMFLILGGIVIAVAWQALWHFGPRAIKCVVGLVAYTAYTGMITFLRSFQEAIRGWKGDLYLSAVFLIPLLLALLLYRVLSRKLIKMTGTDA